MVGEEMISNRSLPNPPSENVLSDLQPDWGVGGPSFSHLFVHLLEWTKTYSGHYYFGDRRVYIDYSVGEEGMKQFMELFKELTLEKPIIVRLDVAGVWVLTI